MYLKLLPTSIKYFKDSSTGCSNRRGKQQKILSVIIFLPYEVYNCHCFPLL